MAVRLVARALLPLLAAGLLGAGGASAAQVSTSTHCQPDASGKGCSTVTTATYAAAPGEANDLSMVREAGAILFTDVVPVEAGTGCASRGPTVATCPGEWVVVRLGDGADRAATPDPRSVFQSLRVDAGDGPDRVSVRTGSVSGGGGDDELSGASLLGGPGADVLTGTSGGDSLDGGTGPDELRAGGGDDTLSGDGSATTGDPAEPAGDLIDGGGGRDSVLYGAHAASVTIDLGTGSGGAPGEDDRLVAIENADGGRGPDRIVGDDGPNRLYGFSGSDRTGSDHDVILGLGGDDDLHGGDGNDRVDGGPGDDTVRGGYFHDAIEGGPGNDLLEGDHGTDRFDGGDGDDLIYVADLEAGPEEVACGGGADRTILPIVALLAPDCELVLARPDAGPRVPAYPAGGGSSRLVYKFACPLPRPCSGRLRLRIAGEPRKWFADRRFSTRTGRVRLVLTVPDAIRARPGERLPVAVRLGMQQGGKPEYDTPYGGTWSFDLRRVRGFAPAR